MLEISLFLKHFEMGLLFYLSFFIYCISCEPRPKVKTNCGTVEGIYLQSRNGRTFSAFFGIKFAQSPTGIFRFEPPQPIVDCPGYIDASLEGPPCVQPNINRPDINKLYLGSEDCLSLNIYTPHVTSTSLLPVMVYFIGGFWIFNSNSRKIYDPAYFMDEDIILVVPNNRQNIFGFMSTEDYVVPGNMALKDQVAALKYVHDNIKFFNGNPERVTIGGDSAGGSTVNLHMRSELSQGLFKQAISQSGTASSAYSIIGIGTSLNYTKSIAALVDCDRIHTQELVDCLRTIDAEKLTKTYMIYAFGQIEDRSLFRPVIEKRNVPGAFLTRTSLVTKTKYQWMIGFSTKDAGLFYIRHFIRKGDKMLSYYDKQWDTFGPTTLLLDDTSTDPVRAARRVRKYYFQNDQITKEKRQTMIDMYTDMYLINPLIMDAYHNLAPTYVYKFDHLGEYTKAYEYGLPKNDSIGGPVHADDALYLFAQNLFIPDLKLNTTDFNISKLMVKLYVNFIVYGDPTPGRGIFKNPQDPKSCNIKWESFGFKRNYLLIQKNKLSMLRDLNSDQYKFWKSLNVNDKLLSNFNRMGYRN